MPYTCACLYNYMHIYVSEHITQLCEVYFKIILSGQVAVCLFSYLVTLVQNVGVMSIMVVNISQSITAY